MATAKKSSTATKAAKTKESAKADAKSAAPKQSSAQKAATKKAPAKKSSAKNAAAKKSSAQKAATKKAPAKKSSAKKTAAKKSSAQKAATKKAPAKKSSAKKTAAKPATKKTSRKVKSPFGPKFIADMKDKLVAERAKYLHSAEEYRAEADALIEGREPGDVQFDEEGGEGDTLAVERERDLALSNQARQAVDQIDAALQRIAKGTYGLCVVSGLPIPQERLRAIPWAAERVEYKAGGLGRL